jgi:glycosidase
LACSTCNGFAVRGLHASGPSRCSRWKGCRRAGGLPWWSDAVFYQIFVCSFYDSDGDGIGDFNGIIEKLDYLNDGDPKTTTDLGVTGIWLMPINPSPSYHGYDVTDYYGVNSDYGTMDDFKRLLDEAHQRGIYVIMDLVLNHTSVEHEWFQEARDNPESARHGWYVWADENPKYKGPWGQDVWYPTIAGYYYAIFWSGMPDLNYANPEVSAEMQNVAAFWLQEVGIDGFRLDAARHLIEDGQKQENTDATHAWWENFRLQYKAINPNAITVGEIWTTNRAVVKYVEGDELDMAFNFDLASQILDNVDSGYGRGLRDAIRSSYSLFPPGTYATFLTNHDQNRVMDQFAGDVNKARLAATVLLTIPGTPFIYYGEEIGMTGSKPDEKIRTPLAWSGEDNKAGFTTGRPWEAVNRDYAEVNIATESADPGSLLSHYRTLIHLRNDHAALRMGEYIPLDAGNNALLAFLRVSESERLLVVINLSDAAVSDYSLALKQGPLAGEYAAYFLLGEGELPALAANASGGFDAYLPLPEIPAYGSFIIQLQGDK